VTTALVLLALLVFASSFQLLARGRAVVATCPLGFPRWHRLRPCRGRDVRGKFRQHTIAGSVSVLSDATGVVVATVSLDDTGSVAYDPAKGEMFVVTPNSNSTSIISDATNTVVATRAAGPGPFEIAYDPVKSELFVTNPNPSDDTVTILSDAASTGITTSGSTPSSSTGV